MSKQALVSLPLLAIVFVALVGCPAGEKENPPAGRGAADSGKNKSGEKDKGADDKSTSPADAGAYGGKAGVLPATKSSSAGPSPSWPSSLPAR